ncbi:MAG: hypothetical protein RL172_2837, partial [Bacteroidota bacterium]
LVKKSNNHFGIKCKSNWAGGGVSHDDDAPGECFRTYKTAEDSYRDHSNYLRGNDRYASLFKLAPSDYKGWAYGLKKAGYATNPKYPQILIGNIERYNLHQYTMAALDEVPQFKSEDYQSDKEEPFVFDEAAYDSKHAINENTTSINGSKCVFVKKGTSLLAVATRQDIVLSKLMQLNDMEEEGLLQQDQLIFLEKKQEKGASDFYKVQPGETVYDVAQKNGIQLAYLLQYNHITRKTVLQPGSKIWLQPAKSDAEAATALPPANKATTQYHAVQAKEGLYSISRKYGVTVQQLKEWNNLSSDNLSIGQQLVVSK